MKWYNIFFMYILLSLYNFTFGMDEKETTIEQILTVLKKEDPSHFLLEPDEFIYDAKMFMKNLNKSPEQLLKHLEEYTSAVSKYITLEIAGYIRRNPERLEKYPAPSPEMVLTFLCLTTHAEKIAPFEQFQPLNDRFWFMQKMACLDTGANLSNSKINPTNNIAASVAIIQMCKGNVIRALEEQARISGKQS